MDNIGIFIVSEVHVIGIYIHVAFSFVNYRDTMARKLISSKIIRKQILDFFFGKWKRGDGC